MDNQKVGSPRATDSPRRFPENGATPLSPHRAVPRVLERERGALLAEMGRSDSLEQTCYDLDNFIRAMKAVIEDECDKAKKGLEAGRMKELATQISNALGSLTAEFDRTNFEQCWVHATSAKGNQVLLLAAIDGLEGDPNGGQKFSAAHNLCMQLGDKLSAITQLVSERRSQNLHLQQQRQQQQQQQPSSPRPSAPRFAQSPERQTAKKTRRADAVPPQSPTAERTARSPESEAGRGRLEKMPSPPSGKRAQGDEDSPQFRHSPAKRHKAQGAEKTISSPSQVQGNGTIPPSGPADAPSLMAPGSPTKVPKLDWSSAKPASTGPHSPLSTTPRTSKHTRTDSKGNEKQDVKNTMTSPAAPTQDARPGKSGDEHPSSPPTSPSSARHEARQDSPRKSVASPPRSLKAQPKPRPPSMLYSSPPVFPGPTERSESMRDAGSDSGGDVMNLQGRPSTASTSIGGTATTTTTSTTTTTTTTTDAGPSTREQPDA